MACTDKVAVGNAFLEKPAGSTVTKDTVFNSPEYTEQFLTGIYSLQYYGLPYTTSTTTSQNLYFGKLDQLTDCWIMHWADAAIYNTFYSGTLDATKTPLIGYTSDKVWEAVRAAYMLLENVDNVPGLSDEKKASFKAQAKCLIASRYFDLFAVYGGLPLIDHTFTGTEGAYELPRATVENTVNYMVNLLDEAIDSNALPWAYNGNTTETDATNNVGRWTKAGAMALKAKILTYAASPLFNDTEGYYGGTSEAEQQHLVWYGDFQQSRWERAKKACDDFFNALNQNGYYELTTYKSLGLKKSSDAYRQAYRKGYADQASKEILHSVRVNMGDAYNSKSYTWHSWQQANVARINPLPTEEYIEMFPWSDGTNFNWDNDYKTKIQGAKGKLFFEYKKLALGGIGKIASRDPRLYEECIVNGMNKSLDWTTGTSSGDIYELWCGGYDAQNNCATYDQNKKTTTINEMLAKKYAIGYDNNKYYMENDYQRKYTQWVALSLSEMYLLYAECYAQTGDNTNALKYVNIVRDRVGLGKIEIKNTKLQLRTNKENLLQEILRERACELGLSNARYQDMVRYKRGDWMTKPLHGLITYRVETNSKGENVRVSRPYLGTDKDAGLEEPSLFEYEKFEISNRKHVLWGKDPKSQDVSKWYLWPFPQSEINKGYGLVQNPGW